MALRGCPEGEVTSDGHTVFGFDLRRRDAHQVCWRCRDQGEDAACLVNLFAESTKLGAPLGRVWTCSWTCFCVASALQ